MLVIYAQYSQIVQPRTVQEAPEGSEGRALLFFNLSARCGWVDNATSRPRDPLEETSIPIV
jgi:hypothetical protein